MPVLSAEPVSFLTDLVDAAVGGTTRVALARRVATVLMGDGPVGVMEIGWCNDAADQAEALVVLQQSDGREVIPVTRPLGPTGLGAVVCGESPWQGALTPCPSHWPAEARSAVVAPLRDEGRRGYVALGLVEPTDVMADAQLLRAMAAVLGVAERNILLIERVARLSRRAYKENQDLRRQLERVSGPSGIVAVSGAMREILELTDHVAPHDTTVLVRGESGTGKELVARRIHALSPRAEGPFLQVNCGAIPDDLVETELFGHERGAFTGASARHVGRFERASGGTLFLDEVGELPLRAQVKLLRVLQEGQLERVGGESTVDVDVRVIAATHRDLEKMVEDGTFRADLYYRLNVFPLLMPPLRDRPEDIPALVRHLVSAIAARLGRAAPEVCPDDLARLCRMPWPGNVRELENALERAIILSHDDTLRLPPTQIPLAAPTSSSLAARPATEPHSLDDIVRRAIEQALAATGGKLYGANGAAALLGLKPSTLQSKMQKLGIERAPFTA